MFGIRPILGRVFQELQKEVVISRGLWKRKWQMNPGIIGKAIALDGENYTIAGVAELPADLIPGSELLLPLLPEAAESRTAHEIEAVGRMREGVEIGQAQAELRMIARSIARENPRTNSGWSMQIVPLSAYIMGPHTGRTIWMIFAAVALLWMLASSNVAGLQVARSISRRHEMSTRSILGASTMRLVGQALIESLVLAMSGSILGLLGAEYAVAIIRDLGAKFLPRLADVQIDVKTICIALGCVLVSILLCAVFAGSPSTFQGGRKLARRDRGRDVLIVAQVALASVLVLGASLLLHSFMRLEAVDPGFNPERILAVHVSLPGADQDSLRRVTFFRNVEQSVAAYRRWNRWAPPTFLLSAAREPRTAFGLRENPPLRTTALRPGELSRPVSLARWACL